MATAATCFDGMNPQKVLFVLKDLSCKQYFVDNNFKKVPASYKVWDKLSSNQSSKVLELYQSLPECVKVILKNRVALEEDFVANTKQTTKNDRIQILELRMSSGAVPYWTKALGTMNREELDEKQSHESDDRDLALEPWNSLATMFNNRYPLFL